MSEKARAMWIATKHGCHGFRIYLPEAYHLEQSDILTSINKKPVGEHKQTDAKSRYEETYVRKLRI
uniref:Uncharacterized protein n=1 Tax=Arundo donax TaxID=35708 RepID=A0A0A9H023_ARUDO